MVRNLGWAHELAAARRGGTALAGGRRGCSGARQVGGRRANVDGVPGASGRGGSKLSASTRGGKSQVSMVVLLGVAHVFSAPVGVGGR